MWTRREGKDANSTLRLTNSSQAGIDEHGESILVLTSAQKENGLKLIRSSLQPVQSCLHSDTKGMHIFNSCVPTMLHSGLQRLILDGICGSYTQTVRKSSLSHVSFSNAIQIADMNRYVSCTFWASKVPPEDIHRGVLSTLDVLVNYKFIEKKQRKSLSNPNDIHSGIFNSPIWINDIPKL